jgi:hypothetical protein
MVPTEDVPLQKQVTRMADGRQLVYYWFDRAPPAPKPDLRPPPAPNKPAGEEGR